MWKAYCDNVLFFDDVTPLKEYKLIDPTLELEENQPGTFTFTLPTENVLHELSNGGYFVTGDGFRYTFRTTEVQITYSANENDPETSLGSGDLEEMANMLADLQDKYSKNEIEWDEFREQSNEIRKQFSENYGTMAEQYLPGVELSYDPADISNEMKKLTDALRNGHISSELYMDLFFNRRQLTDRLAVYAKKQTGQEYTPVYEPSSLGRVGNQTSIGQAAMAVTVTTDTYYKFRQVGEIVPFKSYIRVLRDDDEEPWFEGVVNSISVNFNLEKEVTCDGALSFLSRVSVPEAGIDLDVNYIYDMYAIHNPNWRNAVDGIIKTHQSVQKLSEYDVGGILNTERAVDRVLEIYGSAIKTVASKMEPGNTYIKDFNIQRGDGISRKKLEDVLYWKSNSNIAFEYTDGLTAIQDIIGDKDVYLQLGYEKGQRKLNFIHDENRGKCTQVINFGENLLDYTESWEIDNLITAVLPLGMAVTLQTTDEEGNVVDVDDSYPKVYITLADLDTYKPSLEWDFQTSTAEPKIGNSQFRLSPILEYSNNMWVDSSMVSTRLEEIERLLKEGKIPQDEYDQEYARCDKLLKYYAALQTGNGGGIITKYRFIYDETLVKQYGLRMAIVNFDSEVSPINLMWEGAQYIKENEFSNLNLEISAFDLSYLNDTN